MDIMKANSRGIEFVQSKFVRDFILAQNKYFDKASLQTSNPAQISPSVLKNVRNEELEILQKLIPHFAVRIIKAFEDLRSEGVIS